VANKLTKEKAEKIAKKVIEHSEKYSLPLKNKK